MTLDDLQNLVFIAETGSFTAAARRAHLTQPALSASIRRLESDLGVRLFDRGRSGAAPTALGLALLPQARLALAAVADGRRAVQEVAGLQSGSVALGAGSTACTYLLPPTLLRFRLAYPGVRLFLREAANGPLWSALQAGAIDLALLTDLEPGAHPGLTVEPCLRDELVVVCAPGLDAEGLDWVAFPPESAIRAIQDRQFPGAVVVMELNSIAAVKGNVRAGIGKALVSRAALRRDLEEGSLTVVPMEGPPLLRDLVLAHRGVDQLPPAAARMRAMILEG